MITAFAEERGSPSSRASCSRCSASARSRAPWPTARGAGRAGVGRHLVVLMLAAAAATLAVLAAAADDRGLLAVVVVLAGPPGRGAVGGGVARARPRERRQRGRRGLHLAQRGERRRHRHRQRRRRRGRRGMGDRAWRSSSPPAGPLLAARGAWRRGRGTACAPDACTPSASSRRKALWWGPAAARAGGRCATRCTGWASGGRCGRARTRTRCGAAAPSWPRTLLTKPNGREFAARHGLRGARSCCGRAPTPPRRRSRSSTTSCVKPFTGSVAARASSLVSGGVDVLRDKPATPDDRPRRLAARAGGR